jgi:hypothetical protein
MDANRFDTLTRTLTAAGSRRRALNALLVGTFGLVSLTELHAASAKTCKKIKDKKKRKKCLAKAKDTPPGSTPDTTPVCTPSCAGKVCGDDGCGGICGNACPTGETCVQGECVCLAGTERCGVGCVPPCSIVEVRNPDTCGCCQPNGTPFCTVGPTTRCCSGQCLDATTDICAGQGTGQPCRFDAQCHSNSCVNDQCAP